MIHAVSKAGTETASDGMREVAQSFEAVLAQILLRSMRATVGKSGLFQGGRGEQLYTELLDRSFAEAATRRGNGFGIAEMIQKQLARSAYAE